MKLLVWLVLTAIVFDPALGRAETESELGMVPILRAEFVIGADEDESITHQIGVEGWHDRTSVSHNSIPETHRPKLYARRAKRGIAFVRWLPRMDPEHRPSTGFKPGDAHAHAWLWKPLPNVRLEPRRSYSFTIHIDPAEKFDEESWRERGLALGITTRPTPTDPGNFVAETMSQPSLLRVTGMDKTTHRVTMTYRTGDKVPVDPVGVVLFHIRHIPTREDIETILPPDVPRTASVKKDEPAPSEPSARETNTLAMNFATTVPPVSRRERPTIPTPIPSNPPPVFIPPPLDPPTPLDPPIPGFKKVGNPDPLPEPTTGLLIICSLPLLGLRRWRSSSHSHSKSRL